MNRMIRKLTHCALALSMFLFVLSPATGMGEERQMQTAKLTPDTPVSNAEPAVFDKAHPAVRGAMAVQNHHSRNLLAIPEVVGTAIGLTDAGRPVVLVFTRTETLPGVIPSELDGVPTVVWVTGEIVALKPPQGQRFSTTAILPLPVPIGVSTGNEGECSAGTIGARVKSGGNVYALSNNHVYALENAAPTDGTSHVLQPGLYDTQCLAKGNVLGTLSRFVEIKFNNTSCDPDTNRTECNRVDAAIALSSTVELGNGTPGNGYGIPNANTMDPELRMPVQKYGRTTSLTSGTITGINASVNVSYGTGKNAIFIDQIVISANKPFSKAGDSGSLIVTRDEQKEHKPVGLLFAGGGGITIANEIANVIDDKLGGLGVTIDAAGR